MTGPRLPGIGSHHSARPATDEWLTPPELLEALGGPGRCNRFSTDPCNTPDNWTGIPLSYDAEADGLTAPWRGRVWLNPPYSDVERWIARMADHDDGIALVFARTETLWWFEHVWPRARSLFFLRGRLTFHHENGTRSKAGHNSGGPSVLIAYGAWADERLRDLAWPGVYVPIARTGAHVVIPGRTA